MNEPSRITGYTTAETARLVGALQWAVSELFAIVGAKAVEAETPALVSWLATTSRHLGDHVAPLAEVMPDSVLLEADRQGGPDRGPLSAIVAEATRDPGAALAMLVAECQAIEARCSGHADAALARAVSGLRRDVAGDLALRVVTG